MNPKKASVSSCRVFKKLLTLTGLFTAGLFHNAVVAQDITGTWYLFEVEYEVTPESSSQISTFNGVVTFESLGGGEYEISVDGEGESETVWLEQSGNRFFQNEIEDLSDGDDEISHYLDERSVIEWIDENLMIVSRMIAVYYEGDLTYFEGGGAILTKEPLPNPQSSLWSGNYSLEEIGWYVSESVEFNYGDDDVPLQAMAGNTYRAGDENDGINLWTTQQGLRGSDVESNPNEILYSDSQWYVSLAERAHHVLIVQIDETRLAAVDFFATRGLLQAHNPEEHPDFTPRNLLIEGETYALVLTRDSEELPEISPLATSGTGRQLASAALHLGSDWYFIEWFGFFKIYGMNYGYHIDHGPFYFGARNDNWETNNQVWLYLAQEPFEGWFMFSENLGYGFAFDPQEASIITLENISTAPSQE